MKILGIESSCDESGAAVVVDGVHVLSNAVATQIPVHARYGGVVPELASRNHVLDILPVVRKALSEAEMSLRELDGIAVTQGPGLVGSLLVGIETAKALAYSADLPLVGVHHIEAHLVAAFVARDNDAPPPPLPFIGLVVSGGHTSLFRVDAIGQYTLLGQTRDDAAGEALDKVGKMLGLGYPGGVAIDRLSTQGNPQAIDFPRAMRRRDTFDFSFSGLKTAVRTYLEGLTEAHREAQPHNVCASVQEAVVDILVFKALAAAKAEKAKAIVISGGVSANRRLRKLLRERAEPRGIEVFIPPMWLCTDNAAMIAGLGEHVLADYLAAGGKRGFDAFGLDARSSWAVGAA